MRTAPLVLLMIAASVVICVHAAPAAWTATELQAMVSGEEVKPRHRVTVPGEIQMQRVLFPDAAQRNATCNDGSAAGYYIWRSPSNSSSWMIYLEGGGLCYDLESCVKRPKFLTTSTLWPQQLGAMGILGNQTDNKFAEWNKVVVIYCTSDLYTGTRAQGEGLLGWSFQGKNIVPTLLQDLAQDLASGTELVFTGGSAGGVGTFMNYPFVKQAVSWMPVKALPDAGWFLTTMAPYSKKAAPLPKMLQQGVVAWGGQPPAKCAAALGAAQAYLCYSGPVVYNFMPQPIEDLMVCKAQMDAWTVGHDGVKLPPSAGEVEWLVELGVETRATFDLDKVVNVFSADCIYHTSLQLLWDKVEVAGVTLHEAVESWYFGGQASHHVDTCATPDCNDSCI